MGDSGQPQTAEERIAELEAALAVRDEVIAGLQKQVEELTRRLDQNSSNSHLPPSSDGPGAGQRLTQRVKKASGRKRGGQKGRKGVKRELAEAQFVDEFIDFFPPTCSGCAAELPEVHDADARRTQQVELLEGGRWITEYRRHEIVCPCCGARTRAAYDPAKIPASVFGPKLTAVVVMLTGVYHLSRARTTQLIRDLFGISISVGTVSAMEARAAKALEPVHEEIQRVVEAAAVKYMDGTTWLQDGKTRSLWTVSTSSATLYEVLVDGARETIKPLVLGIVGILVSDRASVFSFWPMARRQVCWAHLIRKFVAFSERDGPAGAIGRELLECASLVFDYWCAFRAGDLTRNELGEWMRPVQLQFEAVLERAADADLGHVSGSCANMLAHREAMWTFVAHEGVEPTNNDAERELRSLVLWRKRSFGSKSERGDRFVARVMSMARTARKQGLDILDFLERTLEAALDRHPAPRLMGA